LTCRHPSKPPRTLVGGRFVAAEGAALDIKSPYTGQVIGSVRMSTARDVEAAIGAAAAAWPMWSATPLKERTVPLFRFRDLLLRHLDDLANLVAAESGKTRDEARAGILRGVEVVEFASSLQNARAARSFSRSAAPRTPSSARATSPAAAPSTSGATSRRSRRSGRPRRTRTGCRERLRRPASKIANKSSADTRLPRSTGVNGVCQLEPARKDPL
jgi:hypothetical protein